MEGRQAIKPTLQFIDSISEWTGRIAGLLCIAVFLVLVYEVVMRYVFGAPTIWVYPLSRMLGGAIVMLGAAYTLLHNKHVRVDIFYGRCSPRGKAIIDTICALFFFLPLMYILIDTSVSYLWFSWSMREVIMWTSWYPTAVPMRAIVLLGFLLLTLQGVAQFIRDSNLAVRNKTYD